MSLIVVLNWLHVEIIIFWYNGLSKYNIKMDKKEGMIKKVSLESCYTTVIWKQMKHLKAIKKYSLNWIEQVSASPMAKFISLVGWKKVKALGLPGTRAQYQVHVNASSFKI